MYLLYNLDIISPSTSHQKTPHSRRSKDRNECEKLKYRERRKEAARKKKLARPRKARGFEGAVRNGVEVMEVE